MTKETTLNAYLSLFEHLEKGAQPDLLLQLTTENIRFIDPFNDVVGQQAMSDVLAHFTQNVGAPTFHIRSVAWDDKVCFIRWDFTGQLPKLGQWSFPGMTELHFTPQGLISLHQDHWDAGQHFYQKLPVIGAIIRFIKRKIQIN